MMPTPGPSKLPCRPSRAYIHFSFVDCAFRLLPAFGTSQADVFTDLCRCTNRNERPQWDTLTRAKTRIIELMWAPSTQTGVQYAAVKFLQKVILVQSRGIADPRVSCYSRHMPRLSVHPEAPKQKRPKPCNRPGRPPVHQCRCS